MAFALGVRAPRLACAAACLVAFSSRGALAADTVVQVPVAGIIDGRTVTTWTEGALVTWGAGQGVDGDGNADGYVTTAAEAELVKLGKTVDGKANKALPDDGLFAADARHPAIQLHFSNTADKASPQTHQLYIAKGSQTMNLPVPVATYSKLFLILTASEGAAELTIKLNYAGAQPVEQKLKLPDYGIGGAQANDAVFFNLIEGMRKWTSTNQEGDGPSHTITGIELKPSATDKLMSVDITKTNGSHVVFWGATGIATSAVDVGGGGTGGTGAGGAAGASGAGGASGGAAGAGGGGMASSAGGSGGTASTGVSGSSNQAGTGGSMASAGAGGAPSGVGGTVPASTPTASSGDDGGCSFSPSPAQGTALALFVGVMIGLGLRRRRAA